MRLCGKIIAKLWIFTIIITIMIISGGQTKRIPAVVLSGEDFTYNLKGLSNNTYYNVVIRFVQVDRIDWKVGWFDRLSESYHKCFKWESRVAWNLSFHFWAMAIVGSVQQHSCTLFLFAKLRDKAATTYCCAGKSGS